MCEMKRLRNNLSKKFLMQNRRFQKISINLYDAIYNVTIAKSIFSRLKITCYIHEIYSWIQAGDHALFCLSYKHTKNDVFDDFPTISNHFPKISQDPPKVVQRQHERLRKFSDIVRRFEKKTEDCRRLSRKIRRCFNHVQTKYKNRFLMFDP